MAGTWDATYANLTVTYGGMPTYTTQDMLYLFWADNGFTGFPGNDAQIAFYRTQGASGSTYGDLAYDYWNNVYSGGGGAVMYRWLMENGDIQVTEAGDALRTE